MSVLADIWGWAVGDIDPLPWLDVLRYFEEAVKCKARRLLDQFKVIRYQAEHLGAFITRLNEMAGYEERKVELDEADQLEAWGMMAMGSEQAKSAFQRAKYLRTRKRLGI